MRTPTVIGLVLVLLLIPVSGRSLSDEGLSGFVPGAPGSLIEHDTPLRLHNDAEAASDTPAPHAPQERSTNDRETWTFLFYDDADFINGYDPYHDFTWDAFSTENLNTLILRDPNNMPAVLFYVNGRAHNDVLGNWGEVDMGDYQTLRDFIAYGVTNYPADRYALAVYDHGGGWKGACVDDTNGGWLTMDDIYRAISEVATLDILCFTAPCLMGALESAYELRDVVDVYIGSEELSGYAYWMHTMDEICTVFADSSHLTNDEIGARIIQIVEEEDYYPDRDWLTMSAVNTGSAVQLADCVDAFAGHVNQDPGAFRHEISLARDAAWEFGQGGLFDIDEIDLCSFLDAFASVATDPTARQLAQAALTAFPAAIIAECHGANQPGANGVSINFPAGGADYDTDYETVALDFVDNLRWDEFLRGYYDLPTGISEDPTTWVARLVSRPNPFRRSTEIRFTNSTDGMVTLRVFDVAGRYVRTLWNGEMPLESGSVRWDGRDAAGRLQPAGVYLYVLETDRTRLVGRTEIVR